MWRVKMQNDSQAFTQLVNRWEKPIRALDGRWFTVRVMPYRTLDDRIDGVVITFADITAAKKIEANLRDNQAILERRVAEQSSRLGQTRKKAKR